MDDQKEYSTSDIKSLSSREWLKKYVFDQLKLDYLSFIKGVVPDPPFATPMKMGESPLIHSFFTNEVEIANVFTAACREFLHSLQLPDDLECNLTEEGFSFVRSHNLAKYLQTADYEVHTSIFNPDSFFSSEVPIDHSSGFSYLLGKYIRFFYDGKLCIMSPREAYMLEDIISLFSGSGDVVTTIKEHGYIPGATHIQLNADHILLEYLANWREKWVAQSGDC